MADEDTRAWSLLADALDEALALDLEDGTRRSLLRWRAYAVFLAHRPPLEVAAEPPPDNVVELGDRVEGTVLDQEPFSGR
jgi:hypothetical protein